MTIKRILQTVDLACTGGIVGVIVLSGAQGNPVMAGLIWLVVAGLLLAIIIDAVVE
jgi:hypothetical protein